MPRKLKPKKIPQRVQRLVSKLKAGNTVVLTVGQGAVERSYCLDPAGTPVGDWTFKTALGLGLIVPAGDGLFPDAESQSYRVAS